MIGSYFGLTTLSLYIKYDKNYVLGTIDTVYIQSGNQDQHWKLAQVSLIINSDYQIQLEAKKGNGENSFVAIDDIVLNNALCSE